MIPLPSFPQDALEVIRLDGQFRTVGRGGRLATGASWNS